MTLSLPSELLEPMPLTGKSPAIALWVRRTPNVFRGVLELDCTRKTVEESGVVVRDAVTAEYSPGLIVPFAFGVILHYSNASPNAAAVQHLVDDRARSRATWQWIIVVDNSTKRVFAVHMWMRGYLTPVYEALIKHFENSGYSSESIVKQPSRFWTRLWATMAVLLKARRVLVAIAAIVTLIGIVLRLYWSA